MDQRRRGAHGHTISGEDGIRHAIALSLQERGRVDVDDESVQRAVEASLATSKRPPAPPRTHTHFASADDVEDQMVQAVMAASMRTARARPRTPPNMRREVIEIPDSPQELREFSGREENRRHKSNAPDHERRDAAAREQRDRVEQERLRRLLRMEEESARLAVQQQTDRATLETRERYARERERAEQDAAFQASLAADRRKEQEKREQERREQERAKEDMKRHMAEQEAKAFAEATAVSSRMHEISQRRTRYPLSLLPSTPTQHTLAISFPDRPRVVQRFPAGARVGHVFVWVDEQLATPVNTVGSGDGVRFVLRRTMPAREFTGTPDEMELTLEDAGLSGARVDVVYLTDEDPVPMSI